MNKRAEATLTDGSKLPYIVTESPPRGSMKYTYFAPDKSYVVQFFNDPQKTKDMASRLEKIIGRYNPTLPESKGGAPGGTAETASYFSQIFCWPKAIVKEPEFGIVSPTYPSNFFFDASASKKLRLKGKDKRGNWFTSSVKKYLEPQELGNFQTMLRVSITLARAIRRMHQAGLAHSDLSSNNVLIDPKTGSAVVIDIDSLVVPGLFAPEVAGTKGYIAPEVVETMALPLGDPSKKVPSVKTDLFALPVLIYQYLLKRHPLEGPKIHSKKSAEEDDFLASGKGALFIENPTDTSNRPPDLKVTVKDLGPALERLFIRAFVDGLHDPEQRPLAMDWEKALVETWDLLQPCENPDCKAKWFILHDKDNPRCPFCGKKVSPEKVLHFRMMRQRSGKGSEWMKVKEINLYNNMPLFPWHFLAHAFPDEKARDRDMQAYVAHSGGMWYLVNCKLYGMMSPEGSLVPSGAAIPLLGGSIFRPTANEESLLIEVVR